MTSLVIGVLVALVAHSPQAAAASADATAAATARLAELRQLLPRSDAWEAWLQRTGELPPDFAALPGRAELPDPLRFQDGRPVKSRADWEARRQELLDLFQQYVVGRVPAAPGNTRVAATRERLEGGVRVRELTLEFGPDHRARLRVELLIPPGSGPFPVFITRTTTAAGPSWRSAAAISVACTPGRTRAMTPAPGPRSGRTVTGPS